MMSFMELAIADLHTKKINLLSQGYDHPYILVSKSGMRILVEYIQKMSSELKEAKNPVIKTFDGMPVIYVPKMVIGFKVQADW